MTLSFKCSLADGKNWLFCQTVAGAAASARLYSLIETAKACSVEPHAYLSHLFTELPKATTIEHIEALLPWGLASTPPKECPLLIA